MNLQLTMLLPPPGAYTQSIPATPRVADTAEPQAILRKLSNGVIASDA